MDTFDKILSTLVITGHRAEEVTERAAIHEYDGGMTRQEAEIKALLAHLEKAGRLTDQMRKYIESGNIYEKCSDKPV